MLTRVEAGTLALLRDEGKGLEVLLTLRPSWMSTYPDSYVFPGGSKELNEDKKGAALRETLEEIGVRVSDAYLLKTDVVLNRYRPGKEYEISTYVAKMPVDQKVQNNYAEVAASHWFTPKDALRLEEQGELKLSPVAKNVLVELGRYSSVDELLRACML